MLLSLSLMAQLQGCAAVAVATAERSWPDASGALPVEGLDASVTITRDALGVPHIRAQTERDLWYAVGFVHAQDRLFQMDLIRRLGSGRVSEWLGEESVDYDAFMQSIDLDGRYAAGRAGADPALLAVGEAYAAGVNAGAASLPALPVEYRVLGVDFEPWRVQDALAATVLNSWALSENAPKEVITLLLRDKLDAAGVDALWRWDPDSPPVDPYWDALREVDIGEVGGSFLGLVEFLWGVADPTASNSWALGPARSADGAPILANDPHLTQLVPSVWHVFEGSGGDVHIAGATLAGTPFPASGHNASVAWGVTNVMADYVDLAVVERAGDRGYVLAGEEQQLRAVEVEVAVKGGRAERRTVWWTEVGPVITELEGTHLVALRWALFEAPDETAQMFYEVMRAERVEDVMEAARRPSSLSQNLVAADVHGAIGWQVFGALPVRRGFTGRLPYPAWDPAYGWDGWREDLPGEVDPERGYIVTANARPDHPDAHAISTAYLPDWRQARISALIEAGGALGVPANLAIQRDELDRHAAERVPELLEGVAPGECGRLLLDWDGDSDKARPEPAIWATFQGELIREALLDDLGEQGLRLYLAAVVPGWTVLDADLEHFLPDREAGVSAALARTCASLKAALGPDPAQWRWGDLHPLHIRHPFSDQSRALEDWSMRPAPWGGSHQTVNQAGYSWYEEDLHTTWMASLRVITPLSDVGAAMFAYPGGQAGHPGHPHYADLFEGFVAGELAPLWFWDEDVRAAAVDVLELTPAVKPAQ